MKKKYRKLTADQVSRGIIFSSCLSIAGEENNIHEVNIKDDDINETIHRLKDDKFFNNSHFNFNIIRS